MQTIMTAHVLVPALDDAAGDAQPARSSRGCFADELGYDGLVIADALEMKGGQRDGRRRARAPCSRSRAGVDALLIGHDLGEEAVAAVQRRARRAPSRRASSTRAACARRPAAWRGSAPGRAGAAARRDLEAAPSGRAAGARARRRRRARRSPPLVVELRPRANIAAGEAEHSLGVGAPERLPGREIVLDESTADAGARRGRASGRPLVVVASRRAPPRVDARRSPTRLAPAVVVEIGRAALAPGPRRRLRRHPRRQPRELRGRRRRARQRELEARSDRHTARARAARAARGARAPARRAGRRRRRSSARCSAAATSATC